MGYIRDKASALLGISSDVRVARGKKPPVGEATGPQNSMSGLPWALAAAGPFSGYGEAGGTAWGYPGLGAGIPGGLTGINVAVGGGLFGWNGNGFIQPRKGSYACYRQMSLHPTLNLIKQLIIAPIMASQWTVKVTPGMEKVVPKNGKTLENVMDFISAQLLPKREYVLSECLRYLEFGWRPFERVYKIDDDGFYNLQKLKPLLPDFSSILHDGQGNFAGLSAAANESQLGPEKTWICTYNGEAGNLYGLSRHESAFDPWLDWQATRLRSALLAGKIAGYLPILYYRPGRTPVGGTMTDNGAIAKQILATCGLGNGAAVPSTNFTDEELQSSPDLAKTSPWKLEIVNCGNYAPALDGIIHQQEYLDKQLVRAWGWPERSVLEAQKGGSRADSQQHTDSASLDRELIDSDIAQQLSSGDPMHDVPGVVDDLAVLNFGDNLKGVIQISPAPLVDSKVQVYTELLKAVFTNPQIAPIFAQVVNWEELLNHLDIESEDDVNDVITPAMEELMQERIDKSAADVNATNAQATAAASQPKATPQPYTNGNGNALDGNKPKGNGGNNKNGKVTKAARILSRWIDAGGPDEY